jgi:arabinose-5-phosphate isomerase
MTTKPAVVQASETLHAALQVMEQRDRQIGAVPVLHDDRCVGVVRVHDIVRAQL